LDITCCYHGFEMKTAWE